ncbi:hypothetical protein OROGR_003002 [Orobanche gracilis]
MPPKGNGKGKGKGAKGKGKPKQTHRQLQTTASASTHNARRVFPHEVIFNILSRLPVKSLLRLKCACKIWRTIVSLPAFVSVHLTRSPSSLIFQAYRIPRFPGDQPLADILPDGHVMCTYVPPKPETNTHSTIHPIHDFPGSDAVGFHHLQVVGSQNGIVCVYEHTYTHKFTLWNPATGSSLHIPFSDLKIDPTVHIGASAGFGFDPSLNEYTIIRIISHLQNPSTRMIVPDLAEVFNFKTGRWTQLLQNENDVDAPGFHVTTETCGAVIGGVPYWKCWGEDVELGRARPMSMSFDVKKSAFDLHPFPWRTENRSMYMGEIKEGRLGAVVWDRGESLENRVLDVWMMGTDRMIIIGYWSRMYRVEVSPEMGGVVGFYGGRGIVQEVLGEDASYLCMTNLENNNNNNNDNNNNNTTGITEDFFYMDDAWPGTFQSVSYKESFTRMPRIGSAIIG